MWYVQAILCLLLLMWIFATKPQFEKFLFCILAICVFIPNTVVIAAQHSKIITTMWDTYMSIFLSTNNFLFHGVFFILGLLLYKNMDELKKMPVSFCLVVMLITGCIQFFLGLKGDTTILGALFRKLSCFMFYLFIFISAYKSRINISAKISVQIRRMSNMIYFMHFTFIYAAKILFSLLGISVVDNYTWMFVMVLLTLIVLSAMINSIEEKKKIKLKIF